MWRFSIGYYVQIRQVIFNVCANPTITFEWKKNLGRSLNICWDYTIVQIRQVILSVRKLAEFGMKGYSWIGLKLTRNR